MARIGRPCASVAADKCVCVLRGMIIGRIGVIVQGVNDLRRPEARIKINMAVGNFLSACRAAK